jgi:hypothetical protein
MLPEISFAQLEVDETKPGGVGKETVDHSCRACSDSDGMASASIADASLAAGGERVRRVSSAGAPLNETRNGEDGDEARGCTDDVLLADGDRERERDTDRLDAFDAPPRRMERRGASGLGEGTGASMAPPSSDAGVTDDADANVEDEKEPTLSPRPESDASPSKAAIRGTCVEAN